MEEEGYEPADWNKEFWMPAQVPVVEPKICMRLMDSDFVSDETAGSIMFFT